MFLDSQAWVDIAQGIPHSFGPGSFVEPGVSVKPEHSFGVPFFFHGKFPDLFECPRGRLLETYSMNVPVHVAVVFCGHYALLLPERG